MFPTALTTKCVLVMSPAWVPRFGTVGREVVLGLCTRSAQIASPSCGPLPAGQAAFAQGRSGVVSSQAAGLQSLLLVGPQTSGMAEPLIPTVYHFVPSLFRPIPLKQVE